MMMPPRPAIFTIDTFGRRALNLFFFPNMAWSLLAAGMVIRLRLEFLADTG